MVIFYNLSLHFHQILLALLSEETALFLWSFSQGQGQQVLGQIQISRFLNNAGLQPIGSNLYKETIASGVPNVLNPGLEGAGIIRQGTLEASNVNVVEEMVNMIETQRAYEVNSKSISATDGMLRFLNNNL